jgi:hypothetical protein
MEAQNVLPCPQETSTGPYLSPNESSSYPRPTPHKIHSNIILSAA